MDIYELPDGKVVTTGSFSVAEWDEYVESLPKSKRATVVAPLGSVSEPIPEDDSGASVDDGSSEPKSAPAKTTRSSSAKGKS